MLRIIKNKIKSALPRNLLIQKLHPHDSRHVLLTFDDGPDPEITPAVLKRLKAYQARAVFFVVGRRIEKAPYLLERIQEEGHIIGNHTYLHQNKGQPWLLPYWRDILRCQAAIQEHTKTRPRFFRPVGGRISLTSLIIPFLIGLQTIVWSLEGEDWRCRSGDQSKKIAENLIHRITPGDIVLLHDDNPHVLEILDLILPAIQHAKYELSRAIDSL